MKLADLKGHIIQYRGRRVKKKLDQLQNLSGKLNFNIPNFVVCGQAGGRPTNLVSEDGVLKRELLPGRLEDVRIYMGRIRKDGEGRPYTQQFIHEVLTFLASNTRKGAKIRVCLGNFVGEILNGGSDQEYLDAQEARSYLCKTMRSISKERSEDLEVIDLREEHPGLAGILDGKQRSQDAVSSSQILGNRPVVSEDIYRFLARMAKEDGEFEALITSPKPDHSNANRLYPMAEISLRLTDLLNGRDFQGGSKLQTKMDQILSFLCNPKMDQISYVKTGGTKCTYNIKDNCELSGFRLGCSERLHGGSLKWLYFDTDECERFYRLKEARDEDTESKIAKYRNLIGGILLGATIGGGAVGSAILAKQDEYRKKARQAIELGLKDARVGAYADMGPSGYELVKDSEVKLDILNSTVSKALADFERRYRFSDRGSLELMKELFTSEAIGHSVLEYHRTFGTSGTQSILRFVDDVVKKQKRFLILSRVNTEPYKHLEHLEKLFESAVLSGSAGSSGAISEASERITGAVKEGKATVLPDDPYLHEARVLNYLASGPQRKMMLLASEGEFTHSDGTQGRIVSFRKDKISKDGIELALGDGKRGAIDVHGMLFEMIGENHTEVIPVKDLALDYYWQTRPVIRNIYERMESSYAKAMGSWLGSPSGEMQQENAKFLKALITEDFIREKDAFRKMEHDNVSAEEYVLHRFRRIHATELQARNIALNPYEGLRRNADALRNTFGYDGYRRVFDSGSDAERIGEYRSENGVRFELGMVKLEGKRYLCLRELGNPDSQYSIGVRAHLPSIKDLMEKLKRLEK